MRGLSSLTKRLQALEAPKKQVLGGALVVPPILSADEFELIAVPSQALLAQLTHEGVVDAKDAQPDPMIRAVMR